MSNENKPVEDQAPVSQPDAATTPIDLASAFKALNQINREAAQDDVDAGEGEGAGAGEPAAGDAEPPAGMGDAAGEQPAEAPGDGADGGFDGGSPDGIQAIDFNAYKQEILRDVQRNAAAQIRKEFNDQNIGYYSISELRVADEETGTVRYRNPDVQNERDPKYYFSSRKEAQDFCDSWNRGVDFEFRKAVNEKQQELLIQEAPRARLIDFMPKWQAMSPAVQQVFDALLEGHEVRDASGREIGFNVNLDAVAAQAEKIAKTLGGNAVQQAAQPEAKADKAPGSSGPAMDMQTGNGKSADKQEPKDIGEALRMYDKENRGGK